MDRLRVAVIYGGRSTEHDVSCRSAAGVIGHLNRDRHDVLPVRITLDGRWIVEHDDRADRPVPAWAAAADRADAFRAMSPLESMIRVLGLLGSVDVAFPCLHGPYGEDGTIQGAFEAAGVPYLGSGVAASAASMDKEITKKLLAAEGVPVADGVTLRGGRDRLTAFERERLGLPAFVKPARGGSSLGVSRVTDWADLSAAVALARESDRKVLVEGALTGREIDVGVLEHPDGRLETSPALEISVAEGHTFFDYAAKYTDAATEFAVPDLEEDVAEALADTAVRVFRVLGCAGLLRVDFFVRRDADGRVVAAVNEVNTMPGMTAVSQYPRMWQAAGLAYPRLLDVLVETATRRSRALSGAGTA